MEFTERFLDRIAKNSKVGAAFARAHATPYHSSHPQTQTDMQQLQLQPRLQNRFRDRDGVASAQVGPQSIRWVGAKAGREGESNSRPERTVSSPSPNCPHTYPCPLCEVSFKLLEFTRDRSRKRSASRRRAGARALSVGPDPKRPYAPSFPPTKTLTELGRSHGGQFLCEARARIFGVKCQCVCVPAFYCGLWHSFIIF